MGQSDWLQDRLHAWLVAFEAGQDLPVETLCARDGNLETSWRDRLQDAVIRLRRTDRLLECPLIAPARVELPNEGSLPAKIGKFRIDGILGQGGYGRVYLGFDLTLERPVAIKVLRRRHLGDQRACSLFLEEAKTVAKFRHAHIVQVLEVGSTTDYPLYVVSTFIEGSTLARRTAAGRLPFTETAEIVAKIASALNYAHNEKVVHRDVKPGNILIDEKGCPYLADFGLALRERRGGESGIDLGTPPYMSPEQVCGEWHRVDGRSDIFSLGIVMYELLTGGRPFAGETRAGLYHEIVEVDPWPPRQLDRSIPLELERICLKALSKRIGDRYSTAQDFASDLQEWLANPAPESGVSPAGGAGDAEPAGGSGPAPVRIVPNGLRSFDAGDSDFFLELLPGPRDRDGLPDSIRLWKSRIEERDPARTFAVGLMYGPSGCGKSSLVKAGLIPRLEPHVAPAYVEAVSGGTEHRVTQELLRVCPDAPANVRLPELCAAIRRGDVLPQGRKVCLIIDQFEQWLHEWRSDGHTDALVQALRQCDGARLQCLLMVRSDFWMAAQRLMQRLEIPLSETRNCNVVDLLPQPHAVRVLSAFGRAYGALPELPVPLNTEQGQFVHEAVKLLAENQKVICVRLSIFAEMAKSRTWTPQTLQELGGAEGVGVNFLKETFESRTAPPHHRYHEPAARAVLAALLPAAGTNIKIAPRSYSDLLACTEYASRPDSFEQLIQLLDTELRLITPADTYDSDPATNGARDRSPTSDKHYQLTHDYLVPSLREWLVGRQRETRRGRAQLRLAELTPYWTAKPERQRLPNAWEYAGIVLFTGRRDRSPAEQKMLRAAHWEYLSRLAVAALLVGAGFVGLELRARSSTEALINQLSTADVVAVPSIITQMQPYRTELRPLLQAQLAEAAANRNVRKQLNFSLALLPDDATQVAWLTSYVVGAPPEDVGAIRHALWFRLERAAIVDLMKRHIQRVDELPVQSEDRLSRPPSRLPAASLIAMYDPASLEAPALGDALVSDLIAAVPGERDDWVQLFSPASLSLLPACRRAAGDVTRSPRERALAQELLNRFQNEVSTPDAVSQSPEQ